MADGKWVVWCFILSKMQSEYLMVIHKLTTPFYFYCLGRGYNMVELQCNQLSVIRSPNVLLFWHIFSHLSSRKFAKLEPYLFHVHTWQNLHNWCYCYASCIFYSDSCLMLHECTVVKKHVLCILRQKSSLRVSTLSFGFISQKLFYSFTLKWKSK